MYITQGYKVKHADPGDDDKGDLSIALLSHILKMKSAKIKFPLIIKRVCKDRMHIHRGKTQKSVTDFLLENPTGFYVIYAWQDYGKGDRPTNATPTHWIACKKIGETQMIICDKYLKSGVVKTLPLTPENLEKLLWKSCLLRVYEIKKNVRDITKTPAK